MCSASIWHHLQNWMSRIRKPDGRPPLPARVNPLNPLNPYDICISRSCGLWNIGHLESVAAGDCGTFLVTVAYQLTAVPAQGSGATDATIKERDMDGTIIGLVAVIMSLGIPLGA